MFMSVVSSAIKMGGVVLKKASGIKAGILSAFIWGSGQFLNRHYTKGIFFLIAQIVFVMCLPSIYEGIRGFVTLGEKATIIEGSKVIHGDNSIILMLLGIVWLFIGIVFLCIYIANIRDAAIYYRQRKEGKDVLEDKEWFNRFKERSFPYIMLIPSVVLILLFVAVPIIFGFLIAFTNYSAPDHLPPKNLVSWVGLKNFLDMFRLPMWNDTFWGVLTWTVIWAIISTLTSYFGGLGVACLVNSRRVKFKKFWRTIYILPWAIPGMISLLVFRNMFNGQFGPINTYLRKIGAITQNIPWLSDPLLAKIVIIVVNFWLGFPYFMAMSTGVMTNISPELLEAARIDGATPRQEFRYITLPLVLYATATLLIMSFAGNFNNFNVIYFLTDGNPINPNYKFAGSTDILITWIYKLTRDNRQFHMASVMSILVFIVIATISTWNFLRTKAFKEEDMLQ